MITAPDTVQLSDEFLTRFTGYPVTLPVFSGPLDLLLYLIRRQDIDIYDIPVAAITGQFLDYLAMMEQLDVDVAGEFLVMAATLLEIKSRMLLPRPPALLDDSEEPEEDPRAELVRKLLEYQQYKSAAGELQRLADERKRYFPRTDIVPNLAFIRPDPELAGNPDAFSLWMALQEMLARVEAAGPMMREVARPRLTIRQQMVHILKKLTDAPEGVSFVSLVFYDGREYPPTRIEIIVTFLALLELMRLHRIFVEQSDLFGDIRIVADQPALTRLH